MEFKNFEDRFSITLHEPSHMLLAIPAKDLLHESNMLHLLDTYGPLIKSGERFVTAAFVCNWLASLCNGMQNMLFCGETFIYNLSLDNLIVQLYTDGHYPLISFKIKNTSRIHVPDQSREEWLINALNTFYREHVRPLLETLAKVVQINVLSLWGQVISTLYGHIEEEPPPLSGENSKGSIHAILRNGLRVGTFGLQKNPFKIKLRYIEHPNDPNSQILVKSVCCLAYRLDAGFGYCYSCPRLKEAAQSSMDNS
ncbi:(2Fe-2S)-binding protein [Paenibacillus sp. NPDC057886]|uniref:(2Fe-2S)-binding protein n=1 Tax=Paenibacillus sp. NPDC057886 TaxID=3346270 RepID=UPI00369958AD